MSSKGSDAERLDRLEARAEIAEVVYRYAQNVRNGRGQDCVHLFTEDGSFEIRDMVVGDPASLKTRTHLKGRDAVVAYLTRGDAVTVRPFPTIHNLIVDVRGDAATSTAVMTAIVFGASQGVVGEYHDSFRKGADGWRFVNRVFTIMIAPKIVT